MWTWIAEGTVPPTDESMLFSVVDKDGEEDVVFGLAVSIDNTWVLVTHKRNYKPTEVLAYQRKPLPYGMTASYYEEDYC